MPDLQNRQEREGAIETALLAAWQPWRQWIVDKPANVPWDDMERDMRAALVLVLAITYLDSGNALRSKFGITAGGAELEREAQQWAGRRAGDLARGFVDHSQQRLRGLTAADAAEAGKVADVVFGPARAEGIAVTEVTTAVTEAERQAAKEIAAEKTRELAITAGIYSKITDVVDTAYWETEKDGRVCDVCRPLHNRPEDEWDHKFPSGPPAHPRCRCWLEWTFEAEGKVIQ